MDWDWLSGLVLLVFGLVLTYLSRQGWYIEWRRERIPMERTRLARGELISGVILLVMGGLQTIKYVFAFLR